MQHTCIVAYAEWKGRPLETEVSGVQIFPLSTHFGTVQRFLAESTYNTGNSTLGCKDFKLHY